MTFREVQQELMAIYPGVIGVSRTNDGICAYVITATVGAELPETFGGYDVTFRIIEGGIHAN